MDDQPNQTIYEDDATGDSSTAVKGTLNVAENGINVIQGARTINFTGSVDVTDAGSDQADIDIQGLGVTFNQWEIGARITAGTGSIESVDITALRDLTTPAVTDVVLGVDNGANGELVQIQLDNLPGGGGGGEVNTASNVGLGTGVFLQKAGVDLQFRSLKDAGTGRISVTASISGSEVDLDVVPGAIQLATLGGLLTVPGQLNASGTPNSTTFLRGDGQWAVPPDTPPQVDSVFGRTGAVVAAISDYDSTQVDVLFTPVSYTPTDGFVEGHLKGIDVALGTGGGVVSSWNTRTGDVVPLAGDYSFDQITISGPIDAQGQPATNVAYQQLTDTNSDTNFWFVSEDASGNYVWEYGATKVGAGLVMSMTPAGNMITAGTFDGRDLSTDGANQDALQTLSGEAAGSTDHGTFTEGIITANTTTKIALQDLETEFRAPSDLTRGEMQNNLGAVVETGTFTITATAGAAGPIGHFGRLIELQTTAASVVVQLPDLTGPEFASIEDGEFCQLRVTSGNNFAQMTTLVTDRFRHGNGYSSAITAGDEDSVFLGFSRATAFSSSEIYVLFKVGTLWVLRGPSRITETDDLTLDCAIEDSGILELNHCNRLNFATGLNVTVTGRTATVDASGGGASGTYVGLTDTPNSFAGDAGKFAKINSAQTAIEHVAGETIADLPVQTGLDGVNDLVAVWDASASDTVHAAIADLVGSVGVSSFNGRTGAVLPAAADYTGAQVTNAPAGGIAATTVQGAIDELDTEKAPTVHTHVVADLTDAGALASLDSVGAAQIDARAVNFSDELQAIATDRLLGRVTAATGDVEELTATQARTLLNVEDGAAAPPYDTADLSDDAVTFSKMQNITAQRLIGRATTGTGDPEEIQINALPSQVSPEATDSLLAERVSDGALVKIDIGNLPGGAGGTVDSVFGRTGAVIAVAGDYTGTLITNTPAGNIASTNVQGALNELDAEKAALVHTHPLSQITDSGALAALDSVGQAQIDANAIGTAELINDNVTFAKIENVATDRILGRDTAGAGDIEELQIQLLTDVPSPAGTESLLAATAAGALVKIDVGNLPAGSGGEANTGANLGLGVGVFEGKAGVTLNFNSLVSQTTALTISEDDPNDEIDFTIADVIAAGASGLMTGADKTKLDGVAADATDDTTVNAHIADATAAHAASAISNAPAGGIAATDVQAAINELDTEKAATAHTHTLADVTDSGALAALSSVSASEIDANSVGPSELQATAVTPGSFKKADITVDAQGRLTAATSGTESFIFACSNETADLETGTAVVTARMPYAFTVTEVRASLTTAATGAALVVDINEGGVSILSTKLSIDAGETTSTTAATPPVISDSSLADDAEITIDIDAVGSTVAGTGLKVTIIGVQT